MSNSKPIQIHVCVVAPTHGQHAGVEPTDLKLLNEAVGTYDIATKGQVYGDSPDEWSPFIDGVQVLKYMDEAGFEAISFSSFLAQAAEPNKLNALVTDVDLYIIDPLFLMLEKNYPDLVHRFESVICDGKKGFCIPLPSRLPDGLRQRFVDICAQKLPLLKRAYEKEGQGEWEAERPSRLLAYLKRLPKEMVAGRIELAKKILLSFGISRIDMSASPKMIGAA